MSSPRFFSRSRGWVHLTAIALGASTLPLAAQEKVDLAAIDRIKEEGFQRS